MPTTILVNLPVRDLARSKAFYNAIGYQSNPMFEDKNATNAVISDTIILMLLEESYFKTFTGKEIVDTRTASEAILVITADTREEVDELADKALAAGAGPSKDPEGHPSMYIRNFADPDGHLFQVFWMDPAALQTADN
ncbi:MAG: VOC family protein [Nakamurella sp.]